ncbi:MAG: hypothetical protein O2887_12210 [Bacteroidetes bacterium]|nr:hypothetical protein [Bacteroidota bacterium]MDA1121235.1 hypothetical protein [Bacteroidota bacterium]
MIKLSATIFLGLIALTSIGQHFTSLKPVGTADRSREVMQDNEFDRNEIGQDENVHCNPLLING